MPIDYAISPVGQASENERLLDSGPSETVRHFDEITDSGPDPSLSIDGSGNPIKITQEASPLEGGSLKTMSPSNKVSSSLARGLEPYRRFYRNIMQELAAPEKSNLTEGDDSVASVIRAYKDVTKSSWRLSLAYIGMTIVTTVNGMVQKGVETLTRQQG